MSLARDALASGDMIAAESYFQHAEHYNRIIMAAQSQFGPQHGGQPGEGGNGGYRPRWNQEGDGEGDDDDVADGGGGGGGDIRASSGGGGQPRRRRARPRAPCRRPGAPRRRTRPGPAWRRQWPRAAAATATATAQIRPMRINPTRAPRSPSASSPSRFDFSRRRLSRALDGACHEAPGHWRTAFSSSHLRAISPLRGRLIWLPLGPAVGLVGLACARVRRP